MFKIISNLQNKPDSYKKKVTLALSIVFILIIITLWVTFVMLRIDTTLGLNKRENVVNIEDVSSPVESLKASLGASIDSLRGLFESSTTYP